MNLARNVAAAALLLTAVACGNPAPPPAPASAPAAPSNPTAAMTARLNTPAPATALPAPAPKSWAMPNLVGRNLQEAQDAIQVLTANAIFVTTSSDATGAGRQQVLDRNWKVCAQNVAPGTTITPDSSIDFAAVKLDERCR